LADVIRLYVIDDHQLIIEGLYSSFDLESEEFQVVGGSLTVSEAIQNISSEKVDIIILDLFINQSDPVSNLKLVRTSFPFIPVVILSYETSLEWQVKMFGNGIMAYMDKGEDHTAMKQKLHRVFAGEMIIPAEVASILMMKDETSFNPKLISESNEIIKYLSMGVEPKQIAAIMNKSESSINKKLQNIRKLYEVKSNTELVQKFVAKRMPL
jgi:DNA-binding NarL/FixJ family response regulator